MKKILIITYYFPPSGGAGVQRTLKFVKYLQDFGWQPVVLTVRDADYPAYDHSLAAEIPAGTPIYRTRIFEPYQLYRKLTGKKSHEAIDIATLTRDPGQKRKWREQFAELVRSWLFIPDARIGWKPFGVRAGLQIIERDGIDLIYSSAPPYTCHLIARDLKRKTGLPWICDFRDSWIGWLSAAQRHGWAARREFKQEASVLETADRILTVSAGVTNDLLGRHPAQRDHRWHILPNGYDGADFQGLTPFQKSDKLTLTYTGSLYGNRDPEFLWQALTELMREEARWQSQFRVHLVGRVDAAMLRRIQSQPELAALVQHIPYLPHQESLRYLISADFLLLIIDDDPKNKGILTGKLYEYLGARKPILALAPPGDATDLIQKVQAGWIAAPQNIAEIKAQLRSIFNLWQQQALKTGQLALAEIEALDRRCLTERLARIGDELLSRGISRDQKK